MLGYQGRTNRREFIAGAALTIVGPLAVSMAIQGSIDRLFATFPRIVALVFAIVLTVLVCGAIVAWFWGWSVLLTRRARDIGLPAWSGVASVLVLFALAKSLGGIVSAPVADLVNFIGALVWMIAWAVWPGAGRPFLPRREASGTESRAS